MIDTSPESTSTNPRSNFLRVIGRFGLTDRLMGAIAFWRVARMFALAIVSGFGLLGFENERRKLGAFVFAVAEWLVFRKPAGAVSVLFSGFNFDLFGEASGDFGLVHAGFHPDFGGNGTGEVRRPGISYHFSIIVAIRCRQ